mmetsp:Transcript_35599/g.120618  ORF Transcript_35599/g.120618 Transcript_35599/m.120618 type:complete len:236 (+) Transcript_35599:1038-1745(+)
MITGPSCWWSPTSTSCFAPRTMGMRLSGSVACVASSMSTWRNREPPNRGSPAHAHVVQMTSAAFNSTRSVFARSLRNCFSSAGASSPWSSLSRMSFRSSAISGVSMSRSIVCSVKWSTDVEMASRDLAQRRTTLRPVAWIFSVSWSTAMFDGAVTRTCPMPCFAKCQTIAADVTVLPVPGGPWISDSGCVTTERTAAAWEWFRSGRPGTPARRLLDAAAPPFNTWGSTSWPRSRW